MDIFRHKHKKEGMSPYVLLGDMMLGSFLQLGNVVLIYALCKYQLLGTARKRGLRG